MFVGEQLPQLADKDSSDGLLNWHRIPILGVCIGVTRWGNEMQRVYLDLWDRKLLNNELFGGASCNPGVDFVLGPWIHLRQACAAAGIDLVTADYLPPLQSEGPQHLYYSFGQIRGLATICQRADVIPAAIYLLEPPIGVVPPQQDLYHNLGLLAQRFRRVYTTSPLDAIRRFMDVPEQIELHRFCYPQPLNNVIPELWERKDRKFLAMINSYNYSPLPAGEFYSERIKALRYFARRGEIDLFGYRWDMALQRSPLQWMRSLLSCVKQCDGVHFLRAIDLWRSAKAIRSVLHPGCRGDKYKTMAGYRFAICYESMGIEGFITEKIFDCFFAGTIPIYLGAPDITDYIPAECFVDMRTFGDYSELRRYLKSLSHSDCEKLRREARDYLGSPNYRRFSKECFASQFIGEVMAGCS
jgi:hypothetical protein